MFINQYRENEHELGYKLDLTHIPVDSTENIPVLKTRKPKRSNEERALEIEIDKFDNVEILSVTALEKLLESLLVNAKVKILKIPFSKTTRTYLYECFDNYF